jgi:hypothetical protein
MGTCSANCIAGTTNRERTNTGGVDEAALREVSDRAVLVLHLNVAHVPVQRALERQAPE